jgi:N-acetylmuramic acid 6-phosphate etherase
MGRSGRPPRAKGTHWAELPTEALHPESGDLDRKSPGELLALMAREDRRVVEAVRRESARVARAASLVGRALGEDGRVLLVGAGTSGRLGILEATECPPTFGTDPDRVRGFIAGGPRAVFRAVEGAEDHEEEGERELRRLRLRRGDVVIGISASSVTPYVRGALRFARDRGARTVLVSCGTRPRGIADVVVSPRVGPEVLSGSTRLKAGTATKLVLNQITLLAMARSNRIYGPFMVDVRPGSAKLRDRARRMVQRLATVDAERARELLEAARGEVKTAVVMERLGLTPAAARRRLRTAKGNLRGVLRSVDARARGPRRRRPARR